MKSLIEVGFFSFWKSFSFNFLNGCRDNSTTKTISSYEAFSSSLLLGETNQRNTIYDKIPIPNANKTFFFVRHSGESRREKTLEHFSHRNNKQQHFHDGMFKHLIGSSNGGSSHPLIQVFKCWDEGRRDVYLPSADKKFLVCFQRKREIWFLLVSSNSIKCFSIIMQISCF